MVRNLIKRTLVIIALALALAGGASAYVPDDVSVIATTVSGTTALTLPLTGHVLENITMAASATIDIPAPSWIGQFMVTNVCQNGTGGYTPIIAGGGGVTLKGTYPTPTTTANKCDICGWAATGSSTWQLSGCSQNQ